MPLGSILGRRPKALIGKPGDLPSRRSSGDREKFSAGGKVFLSFVTTSEKSQAACIFVGLVTLLREASLQAAGA